MRVVIGKSVMMLLYLLGAYGTALLLIVALPVSWIVTLLLLGICLGSFYLRCQHYGWIAAQQKVVVIEINNDGLWHSFDFAGNLSNTYRLKSSVVFPFCLVIYLTSERSRVSHVVIVMKDAITAEQFRQLRVRLRDPESWAE